MGAILTVIIPVYNGEKYIERAVMSVLNQPLGNCINVLLIDDGSKDSSGKICDRLADENGNVHVIHKENGGVSSARNLGLQNVKTKYVAFLDCDDWWEPNFFDGELVQEFRKEISSDIYQFSYQETNYHRRLKKLFLVRNEYHTYSAHGFNRYDWAHHCSFITRTRLLQENEIQYLNSKVGEDGPFVEMALYYAKSLHKMNRIMFSYWKNSESCVHTMRRIDAIKEEYKALQQEEAFFSARGETFDADVSLVWTIANSLPKLCGTCQYCELRCFMKQYCLDILNSRPDLRFRKNLWSRLESYRNSPWLCWLKYRATVGFAFRFQQIISSIPVINQVVDYCYTRYIRGYIPV